MIGNLNSIFKQKGKVAGAVTYDADALAFFSAANITNATQKLAVNQLVLDLKSANIWTKSKALYPLVGGVASSHAVNLKTPGTYNLTFATGMLHQSSGINGNSISTANTNLTPSTALSGNLNNTHLSFYCSTNNPALEIGDFGSLGTNSNWTLLEIYQSSFYNLINQNISTSNFSMTNSTGMFIGSRTANNILKSYKNSNLIATFTTSSNSLSNISITICGMNRNIGAAYLSNRTYSFASIGDGLTDAEALAFYTAVQTYQTTLGRQV
jgi:hypothetical protein